MRIKVGGRKRTTKRGSISFLPILLVLFLSFSYFLTRKKRVGINSQLIETIPELKEKEEKIKELETEISIETQTLNEMDKKIRDTIKADPAVELPWERHDRYLQNEKLERLKKQKGNLEIEIKNLRDPKQDNKKG